MLRLDNKIIHYPSSFKKTNIVPTILYESQKLEENTAKMFFDEIGGGDWFQVIYNNKVIVHLLVRFFFISLSVGHLFSLKIANTCVTQIEYN